MATAPAANPCRRQLAAAALLAVLLVAAPGRLPATAGTLPRRHGDASALYSMPHGSRSLLAEDGPSMLFPDPQAVPRAPADPTLPVNASTLSPIRRSEEPQQQWDQLVSGLTTELNNAYSAIQTWQQQPVAAADDAALAQAVGRALFALSRFKPQEVQGLVDPGLWVNPPASGSNGQADPRQCVWRPATVGIASGSVSVEEVPALCYVDPAAGVQVLRGGRAPSSELDL